MKKTEITSTTQHICEIVKDIKQSDYEGDRNALREQFKVLGFFSDIEPLASKIFYWRGFAMWRIAVNGFNDSADFHELDEAIKMAIKEFDAATLSNFENTEAKIGGGACRGLLAYLHRESVPFVQELVRSAKELLHEAEMMDSDNPRLLWVLGPIYWNTSAEHGGGPDKAIEVYKKGLDNLQAEADPVDSLEPIWGEPELLMSLAWSYLNHVTPDPDSAERYALAALRIVPYWHYTRDILLPQIVEAKKKMVNL